MTKFLKKSSSGFLVGDSVTWADLQLAELASFTEKYPTLYNGYPEVSPFSLRTGGKSKIIPAVLTTSKESVLRDRLFSE
ncbi:hypothetical protein COOONC_19904 [Cooperia oncophora]